MNNKLSNKPSKKDRPRSTDKSSKPKRRGDQTPEKSMTPVPSVLGDTEEGHINSTVGNVLSGDDIETLAVNMEELQRNRPPKCPVVEKTPRQVVVKKAMKTKDAPDAADSNGNKIVTVARPLLSDSRFNSCERIGHNDPSLDDTVPYFEHHILGTLEEFKEQNEKQLHAKKMPVSHNEKEHQLISATRIVKGRMFPAHTYKPNMNQSNALNNWERQMAQRRKQQGHLARLLNTSVEMLGMNQNEEYRATQEERHLIDRSIHSKDYGKGYRVGSEFWKQAELIGDDDTGIHMTLTQTERGYPPAVEHVGKPVTVRKETGIDWSDAASYRSTVVHHPWRKSSYLQKRKEELKDVIDELCPHKPYLQELEIIGEPLDNQVTSSVDQRDTGTTRMNSLSSPLDETHEDNDPLSMHPDVLPQPIFGPSLTLAGRSAVWNGSTHNRLGEVGVSCRVLLEAKVKQRVVSTLDVYNDGTAAIYYSWKSVPKVNKLGTTLAGHQQRFYFDKNIGVIRPGDTMKFPFIFKSSNPGMFSEQWQLETQPVLDGGAAIRVLLRGLALQDDLNAEKRRTLEKKLNELQVKQIAQNILREIVDGVRSPERPASPVDAYLTDEEAFFRKNPEMYYNEEVIQELKQLYHDIDPDEDWDLSVSSLRKLITVSNIEDEDQLDGYLSRLNHHVKNLAFAPRFPIKQEMYSTCYMMLCELVDGLVAQSEFIRSTMGLSPKEAIDGSYILDDGPDKKAKKTSEGTRLNVDKKDSRKDKRSADRPTSHKHKTPTEKKPSRGNTNNQSRFSGGENHEEIPAISPPEIVSPEHSASLVAEDHYRDRYFCQAYGLVSETVEKIAGMFEDIENSSTSKSSAQQHDLLSYE